MTNYTTPGVFVQEISKFPPSVAQVATAIPAFMGHTKSGTALEPTRIKSMAEFEAIFGGAPDAALTITIGTDPDVTTQGKVTGYSFGISNYLYFTMQHYFANGGGVCYVVSTGTSGSAAESDYLDAIGVLRKEDEPTLLVPTAAAYLSPTNYFNVVKECLSQCNTLQDRFTIIDVVDTISNFRDGVGINYLKYGAAYYPFLQTSLTIPDSSIMLDASGAPTSVSTSLNGETLENAIKDGSNAIGALLGSIRSMASSAIINLPPSAAIAGIYASVDRDRGVWKAPANVSLNAVIAPETKINDADQGTLNVDPTAGKSINAIRSFAGKGTLVWGARTLAGNDNEWRYVPVRRLFITVEESIRKSTSWAVFEPNDANTWVRIKAQIENYLTNLWKDGALAGAKSEEAFYVAVGLGSTMTADDILNGYMNIEIGMAAVRPAEFIVLKFSHKLQTS